MGTLSTIFKSLLTGTDPIADVTKLIAQVSGKMSPELTAALQTLTAQLAERRDEVAAAQQEALAELQSKNITTETGSEDAYVRRARPTFLYVMIIGIAFSIVIFPLINLATGKGLQLVEIPSPYLDLFGTAFLGYTGARTWEKVKGVSIAGGPLAPPAGATTPAKGPSLLGKIAGALKK